MTPAADHPNYHEIGIVSKTMRVRNPREVFLLNSTVPIVMCMFVISIVFTIWPAALNHAPIGFERRGIIHHIWHYSLLFGSVMALCGQFSASSHRMRIELLGLIISTGAVGMNLAAVIAEGFAQGNAVEAGFALALKIGVALTLLLRIYVLYAEPTVMLPVPPPAVDDVEDGNHGRG
jgi:hypothetical protein